MNWRRLLPYLDVILEVADARLPRASRNPELAARVGGRARILLLNKMDLADPRFLRQWVRSLRHTEGIPVVPVSGLKGQGLAELEAILARLAQARPPRRQNRSLRAVVVGIPNVGKSTLVNCLLGRAAAKTGALPGITRGEQWLRLRPGMELLDTPGRLGPRSDLPFWQLVALRAVPVSEDQLETSAEDLLAATAQLYPGRLAALYGEPEPPSLEQVARARSLIGRGGLPDRGRAANVIWTDFWNGRWGALTLEVPPEKGPERPSP